MTAEELLKRHPLYAAKIMAAIEHGSPATPDWFVVKKVFSDKNASLAEIEFEYNELFVPAKYRLGNQETIVVPISKMNLSLLSANGPVDLTVSSLFPDKKYVELFVEKFSHVGIVFTEDDLDNKIPKLTDTALSTTDKSVRWYGKVNVQIREVVEKAIKYVRRKEVILDYNKSFNSNSVLPGLISGINRDNSTELPIPIKSTGMSFVDGVVREIDSQDAKVNTAIDVVFSYPYSGNLTLHYNRRSFHKTFSNPVICKGFGSLTENDVLTIVNFRLQSDIKMSELYPFTVPKETVRGEVQLAEGRHRLLLKETSLAHLGEVWIEYVKDYVP